MSVQSSWRFGVVLALVVGGWMGGEAGAQERAGLVPIEYTVSLPGGVPLVLVRVPAGSFVMGSTDDSSWSYYYGSEQPMHPVTIADDLCMGKYEVTQAQWKAVMGVNPVADPNRNPNGLGDDYPVYFVSWNDITGDDGFLARLNALGQGHFRLPSEAEWEYACRAGSTGRFCCGDSDCECCYICRYCLLDDYAWTCYSEDAPSHGCKEVGQKFPNMFGLYDMHGNVWEWCEDDLHWDYNGAPTDGRAWVDSPRGSQRVVRGGSWITNDKYCRSADRNPASPDTRGNTMGLRLVRTVPEDLNGDGQVDGLDVLPLASQWDSGGNGDFDSNGTVDIRDILWLLRSK